jgi:UbiD family decarboxylase
MVFGSEPLLFAASASEIPEKICELNYVGAIRGEPVPIIKGRVTGLPIPANAEIAIEGFADPVARKTEGPFGEWTGYYAGGKSETPFVTVSTLYHRNDPILGGTPPARGSYSGHSLYMSVWRSALLYNELSKASIPGIKGVWFPEVGGRFLQIVAIEQLYDGHATQVGQLLVGTRGASRLGRNTIVVDDDINPYDLEDVLWAVCTRSQPSMIDIIKNAGSGRLDPQVRKSAEERTTSRAIIYAVKPFAWKQEFPPVSLASEESRNEIFQKWKDLFKDRWQTI